MDKKNTQIPLLNVVTLDLMLAAILLAAVVFLRMGLPALRGRLAAPTPAPVATAAPTPAAAEAEEDERTPWQIRFADHFTEETVITANSYTSPWVSIQLETREKGEGEEHVVYHVADIYLGSPELFQTYTANGRMEYFETQDVMEMDAAAHAILSISGDFLTYRDSGLLIRNGEAYRSSHSWNDICVLFADGSMEIYENGAYEEEQLMARGVMQVWSFGPSLLDAQGQVMPYYETSLAVSFPNPRSAIGYYEPGHYCFVVVDGRQEGYSNGMTINQLAQVFRELGCTSAYNLDGGGSAVMVFNHERYSRQSNGGDRQLGDILLITEPGWEEKR